ncbi:MAG: hypothetical protein JOS17DRAFT_246969 [Linnemannia elongata]|nr:MAG: hypothetical protein JOS17DRAFT_246969 [Linnemannia elongata]
MSRASFYLRVYLRAYVVLYAHTPYRYIHAQPLFSCLSCTVLSLALVSVHLPMTCSRQPERHCCNLESIFSHSLVLAEQVRVVLLLFLFFLPRLFFFWPALALSPDNTITRPNTTNRQRQ